MASNKKQFGVWMDKHQATIIGSEDAADGPLAVIANVKGEVAAPNSSEKTGNNHEKTVQQKFFKEVASNLVNATHVHLTGTGQAQEQFVHFLEETPQFKNIQTDLSTSNKMSDEKLIEFFTEKLA